MLVKEYTDSDCEDISTQLLNLQKQWQDFAQSELERLEKEGESTWMLENCLAEKQGAAATFCGIKIADDGKWIGYALGDSCLLEISEDNRILNFYPSVKKNLVIVQITLIVLQKERVNYVKFQGSYLKGRNY